MDRLAHEDGHDATALESGVVFAMRGALEAGDRMRAVALYADAERESAAAGVRPQPDVIALFREAIRAPERIQARPLPSTPFFGREPELAAAEALLRGINAFVLLHGPGGVGKTRLALRLVETMREEFDDVRWFDIGERRGPDVEAWLADELADVPPRSRALIMIDE